MRMCAYNFGARMSTPKICPATQRVLNSNVDRMQIQSRLHVRSFTLFTNMQCVGAGTNKPVMRL